MSLDDISDSMVNMKAAMDSSGSSIFVPSVTGAAGMFANAVTVSANEAKTADLSAANVVVIDLGATPVYSTGEHAPNPRRPSTRPPPSRPPPPSLLWCPFASCCTPVSHVALVHTSPG